jgi:hypothetical protein
MLAIIKILLSAVLIYLVNEVVVARSKPLLGALIASLPLTSLLTFLWIWIDLKDRPAEQVEKLAAHSTGVFWFVLPSLPMFLIFPALLRRGLHFGLSITVCIVVTMALYAATAYLLRGVRS